MVGLSSTPGTMPIGTLDDTAMSPILQREIPSTHDDMECMYMNQGYL